MAVQKEKTAESVATKKIEEPKYTVQELAAASTRFGVRSECITAAMQFNHLQEATLEEAKKIVEKFMKMEVK